MHCSTLIGSLITLKLTAQTVEAESMANLSTSVLYDEYMMTVNDSSKFDTLWCSVSKLFVGNSHCSPSLISDEFKLFLLTNFTWRQFKVTFHINCWLNVGRPPLHSAQSSGEINKSKSKCRQIFSFNLDNYWLWNKDEGNGKDAKQSIYSKRRKYICTKRCT